MSPRRSAACRCRPLVATLLASAVAVLAAVVVRGAQASFPPENGPTVLIDEGHFNHFAWQMKGMIRLLADDGYRVRTNEGPFTSGESLERADIVVITNPLAAENAYTVPIDNEQLARAWSRPVRPAFTSDEVAVLKAWVEAGGSLLLVFDHPPVSTAVRELAEAFDIEVADGYVYDGRLIRDESGGNRQPGAGVAAFRSSDGTLVDDPVARGRQPVERIDLVVFGGGSAFRLPPTGRPLLRLGPSYVSVTRTTSAPTAADTPSTSVGGWLQGGVLSVGAGRLAVFADSGFMTTPEMLEDATVEWRILQRRNAQFVRNVMHWLSGLVD